VDVLSPIDEHTGAGAERMPSAEISERFLAAIEPHRRILYKVARAYGRSVEEREDIVQETVVQLWRAYPRYDPAFRFTTWMYRIALNSAISWRRRERTQTQHLHPEGEELLAGVAAADSDEDADVVLLYRCIERYADLDKALLMLYLDGQEQREIASVLGLTPTNVATRIGRLKERLRADFRAAGHL
jgi:RNA polymerase sigma-70 factor (ECF subfamily)